jgi:hypothetical protein
MALHAWQVQQKTKTKGDGGRDRGGARRERGRDVQRKRWREGGSMRAASKTGSKNKECRGENCVRWQMAGDTSDLGARAQAIVETGFVAEAELK